MYSPGRRFFLLLLTVSLVFILRSCDTRFDFTLCFQSYPDLTQSEQFLKSLAQAYPQLARLSPIGFSVQGRAIWALEVGSNKHADREKPPGSTKQSGREKPQLLFTSLIHADEWISLPVVLYLAYQFVNTYESDREIRYIVDNSSLWFVPVVNPDGYEYSRSKERGWRKNRASCGGLSIGVDLNRNFDCMWNIEEGFSRDPNSPFYRGPKASSEPETRALEELAASISFKAAIDFHSFGQHILYPYGYLRASCADDELFKSVAATMAGALKAVNGSVYEPRQLSSIYSGGLPSGTLMDYLYGSHGTLAFTVELAPRTKEQGGVQLAAEKIIGVCKENFVLVKFLCGWIIEH